MPRTLMSGVAPFSGSRIYGLGWPWAFTKATSGYDIAVG